MIVYYTGDELVKISWLHERYPFYYFPEIDLPRNFLKPTQLGNEDYTSFDLTLGTQNAEPQQVVTLHHKGPLTGLFTIKFTKVDMWFEEDEQIIVHPKDPYKVAILSPGQ